MQHTIEYSKILPYFRMGSYSISPKPGCLSMCTSSPSGLIRKRVSFLALLTVTHTDLSGIREARAGGLNPSGVRLEIVGSLVVEGIYGRSENRSFFTSMESIQLTM